MIWTRKIQIIETCKKTNFDLSLKTEIVGKMIRRLIFTLGFAVLAVASTAQTYELGLTPDGVSMPSTVDLDDTYYIELTVENKGTIAIADTLNINIRLAVYESATGAFLSDHQLYSYSGNTLQPGDTVPFLGTTLWDEASLSYSYVPGDNIIVVWPVVDVVATQTTEYHFNNLYVNDPNSVEEEVSPKTVKVFTTSERELFIETKELLEMVEVFDLSGKKIFETKETSASLKSIPQGIYIAQISFKDGEIHQSKFLVK